MQGINTDRVFREHSCTPASGVTSGILADTPASKGASLERPLGSWTGKAGASSAGEVRKGRVARTTQGTLDSVLSYIESGSVLLATERND